MPRFDVLCDENTLVSLFNEFLITKGSELTDVERLLVITNWYKLIFSKSDLCIDLNYERWKDLALTDPMFKQLWKSHVGGGSRIQINEGIIADFDHNKRYCESISPLFLIENEKEKRVEPEQEFGRLFISKDELYSKGKLIFNEYKFIVKKDNKSNSSLKSWDDLKSVKTPLTDILIIDNYILKDIELDFYNITGLLKGLINIDSINHSVSLTIITEDTTTPQDKFKPKIEKWLVKLEEKLKETIPLVQFNVSASILTLKGQNHDRAILTNYAWINSGNSFSYFNEKGKPKMITTLQVIPIHSSSATGENTASAFDCWLTIKEHAKKLIENSPNTFGLIKANSILA